MAKRLRRYPACKGRCTAGMGDLGCAVEVMVNVVGRNVAPSDRDVLLFPWCPDGGLDTEPELCISGLERRREPADKDVLQFPWWPDGALDGAGWSYWNTDDHCLECEVQATEGPMCGLSASCASLKASA